MACGLKTFGEDHTDVAAYRCNIGVAWYNKGEFDKAIRYLELALTTYQKALGRKDSTTKIVIDHLNQAKQKNKNP